MIRLGHKLKNCPTDIIGLLHLSYFQIKQALTNLQLRSRKLSHTVLYSFLPTLDSLKSKPKYLTLLKTLMVASDFIETFPWNTFLAQFENLVVRNPLSKKKGWEKFLIDFVICHKLYCKQNDLNMNNFHHVTEIEKKTCNQREKIQMQKK